MKELLNKEIEMDDGSRYVVVDVAKLNDKNYALISNISDILDSEFTEVKIENGEILFEEIDDPKIKFDLMRLMQD